jgi:hypothetical protein
MGEFGWFFWLAIRGIADFVFRVKSVLGLGLTQHFQCYVARLVNAGAG